MRTVRALRTLLSLPEAAWPPVIHALYRAYWQRGLDITQAAVLRGVLVDEAGLSPAIADAAVAAAETRESSAELRRRTDEAVARGIYAAPCTVVDDRSGAEPLLYFGQDRLQMVSAALRGWRGEPTGQPIAIAQDERPGGQAGGAGRPTLVQFWYDVSSPFAYLASVQIEAIAARAGARLQWRPFLLGARFKELGTANVPLFAMSAVKRAGVERDLHRWAAWHGVPYRFPSRFPMRTVTALRLALIAGDGIATLSHALFRALWVEDRDLDDHATLRAILGELGHDADAMLARTRDPEVQQMLVARTAEAQQLDIFGAPTMIVKRAEAAAPDDMLIWGQDRMDHVAAALNGWRPPCEVAA
jgi:2-hydroxychromene-2-carboxylate isomerase